MCAQFLLKFSPAELMKFLSAIIIHEFDAQPKILPYRNSWVVVEKDGKRVLEPMQFSLVPSWAKERKVKFATHNARIETLLEKPTWKKPIQSKRALVPLSAFIEPIYEGEYRGNMVQFIEKDEQLLTACAVYDQWHDPQSTTVLESFAIITSEPGEFVKNIGHDRQPVFLPQEKWDEWINHDNRPADKVIEFMKKNKIDPQLKVAIDRPLKAGWEKRANA